LGKKKRSGSTSLQKRRGGDASYISFFLLLGGKDFGGGRRRVQLFYPSEGREVISFRIWEGNPLKREEVLKTIIGKEKGSLPISYRRKGKEKRELEKEHIAEKKGNS